MDQQTDVVFEVDLTSHEMQRRTEIMRALGPGWDPIAVLRGEEEAYALLYGGLDREQQEVYDALREAGVLAERGDERRAA
jgi:hypothetical protein